MFLAGGIAAVLLGYRELARPGWIGAHPGFRGGGRAKAARQTGVSGNAARIRQWHKDEWRRQPETERGLGPSGIRGDALPAA